MTVEINVHGDELRVELSGTDMVGALRRSLTVPTADVTAIELVDDPFEDPWRGLRMPGTAIPWRFHAGSYRGRDGWRFLVVRRGQPAVGIDLRNHRFDRIVVQTDDPAADVERLQRSAATPGR